jgi:ribosomal protein S18 acetylase RimI-like enzyme
MTMAKKWLKPRDLLTAVKIRPFMREDQLPVKQLILSGLAEHWGWLDPQKNPDLDDLASYYAEGLFLVAVDQGEIIGTGGLLAGSNGQAQIVRVTVSECCRRSGLGSLIVDVLCENARERGFKEVVLETTETWEDAISFYEHNGFRITHYLNGDVYMAKQLENQAEDLPESGTAGEI